MALTKIEWTATRNRDGSVSPGYTFNPWRGCTKVSEGCRNCCAETLSARNPNVLGQWGPCGRRSFAAESYWRQPAKWNREAEASGERRKVFCASLSDVFEVLPNGHPDSEMMERCLMRLWSVISATPSLDWLLLTKRPENVEYMTPICWKKNGWPKNVWLGTSVEYQNAADERIPHLMDAPAALRFLSCEPLLGPVEIPLHLGAKFGRADFNKWGQLVTVEEPQRKIHWVIAGGESGPGARPCHPDWARSLRDQCQASGVAFHFKQWGEWLPLASADQASHYRNAPMHEFEDGIRSVRVGKKLAGRVLDGRTWDEMPEVSK